MTVEQSRWYYIAGGSGIRVLRPNLPIAPEPPPPDMVGVTYQLLASATYADLQSWDYVFYNGSEV